MVTRAENRQEANAKSSNGKERVLASEFRRGVEGTANLQKVFFYNGSVHADSVVRYRQHEYRFFALRQFAINYYFTKCNPDRISIPNVYRQRDRMRWIRLAGPLEVGCELTSGSVDSVLNEFSNECQRVSVCAVNKPIENGGLIKFQSPIGWNVGRVRRSPNYDFSPFTHGSLGTR